MISNVFDAVKIYPPLDKDKEKELFNKLRTMEDLDRDETEEYNNVREKIINHHIWLSCFIVQKHFSAQANYSVSEKQDLIQAGLRAIIENALPKFDLSKGFRFSTYARWWVYDGVNRLLQKMSHIRVPQQLKKIQTKLNDLEKEMEEKYQEMDIEDKAEELGESEKSVKRAEQLPTIDYLGKEKFSDGEETLIQYLEDSDSLDFKAEVIAEELRNIFDDIFEEIEDREEKVLKARFGWEDDERTLRDIGEELDLSRERIRQIESAALTKIKGNAETILKDFVN